MARKSKADELAASQRKQLVDEYGELDAELSPVKSKLRRMEELAKIIRSWQAEENPESTLSSAGDDYEVVLGAAGMQTHIKDIGEVFRALGRDRFLQYASITLKALEQSGLDLAAIAALTEKRRTGPRAIVVHSVRRAAA